MKCKYTKQLAAGVFALALCARTVHAQIPPKMKMTTEIPPGIATPDKLETPIGILTPKPPKGMENNWIQTVPGKGWNVILRLYGPLQSFYDKTWRPGDPELVE